MCIYIYVYIIIIIIIIIIITIILIIYHISYILYLISYIYIYKYAENKVARYLPLDKSNTTRTAPGAESHLGSLIDAWTSFHGQIGLVTLGRVFTFRFFVVQQMLMSLCLLIKLRFHPVRNGFIYAQRRYVVGPIMLNCSNSHAWNQGWFALLAIEKIMLSWCGSFIQKKSVSHDHAECILVDNCRCKMYSGRQTADQSKQIGRRGHCQWTVELSTNPQRSAESLGSQTHCAIIECGCKPRTWISLEQPLGHGQFRNMVPIVGYQWTQKWLVIFNV